MAYHIEDLNKHQIFRQVKIVKVNEDSLSKTWARFARKCWSTKAVWLQTTSHKTSDKNLEKDMHKPNFKMLSYCYTTSVSKVSFLEVFCQMLWFTFLPFIHFLSSTSQLASSTSTSASAFPISLSFSPSKESELSAFQSQVAWWTYK